MPTFALSRHLSFHARGDAAFVWHGLTGDVAEMSRDVVGLLLAFKPEADDKTLLDDPPAGLTREQVDEFVSILRARRFLVQAGAGGKAVDEHSPLLPGIPRIPRATVFERKPNGRIVIYKRDGAALELDEVTSQLFARVDGEKTLGQVLGDAGPSALPELLRLARADVAALKILAKPVSQGGVHLNPAAESTMPYPEIPDAAAYVAGGPAPQGTPEAEPTLAALFAEPHSAVKNRSWAQAIADELVRRGAFGSVRGRKGKVVELELGFGLGQALREALAKHDVEVETVNLLKGKPQLAPESVDAVVASEIASYLGSESQGDKIVNHGALQLVRDAAAALAPGGVLLVIDFGDAKADPIPTGAGFSIRFSDLQKEATSAGLGARVLPVAEALDLDLNVQGLSTTKASFPALQALFKAHGAELTRRAWTRSEVEALAQKHGLDLGTVQGLQWAPLSERALGLSPKQFWALVAQKPERVLH